LLRSRHIGVLALQILLCSGATIPAAAQEKAKNAPAEPAAKPAVPLAQGFHETIEKVPVTVTLPSGKRHSGQMVLTHFRPKGDGPFPIVIFNHGRGTAEARAATPRYRHPALVDFLIRRGFAVFEPTRLGYGDAGLRPDPESNLGVCTEQQYALILSALNAHNEATLKFAKTLPWVDSSRVIVMGQSLGGFSAIGATQIGATGAINFVGGAGGSRSSPRQICGPSQIGAVFAAAGKRSTTPTLWLYAENDRLWGADWPRKWHAAYLKAGGKAEFTMFPPVDDDGHKLITKAHLWRPVVDRYLQKLGFAPPKSPDAPPPSDFARLEEADKLPYAKESAKTGGYQKFLEADFPRAFVVSTAGAWAWRSGDNASERALDWCRERSKGTCHLYAVDDTVVFKPPESAEAAPAR
jgi:dienelactone hydrolase